TPPRCPTSTLFPYTTLFRSQDRIPLAAPKHLNHIPTGAAERRLQFLNDLAVAAHWTVEALQVAVDDENQIVEPLPGCQRDGAERFRLVRLAIAEERPDFRIRARFQPAIFEIAVEARLINSHQRAEAHGDGRKLPKIRHQP